jgi:hypothetical protein
MFLEIFTVRGLVSHLGAEFSDYGEETAMKLLCGFALRRNRHGVKTLGVLHRDMTTSRSNQVQ